jgi:hypothetical protein
MSKIDQLRALREAKFARQAKPKAERLVEAKAALITPKPLLTKPAKTNATRQAKWREANIETQRERSRSSMRKLREKKANG